LGDPYIGDCAWLAHGAILNWQSRGLALYFLVVLLSSYTPQHRASGATMASREQAIQDVATMWANYWLSTDATEEKVAA
jgi:hypothetical protein